MLKIAQHRGINVELPLQEQIRWHGNGNGSDAGSSSLQSILRHVSSGVGVPVMRGDTEVRGGQDMAKKKKRPTYIERENEGRRHVGWYSIGDRGDARRHDLPGPRKYPHLRG